jgi:hypothetical protein
MLILVHLDSMQHFFFYHIFVVILDIVNCNEKGILSSN